MRAAALLFACVIAAAPPALADDSCLVRGRVLDHDGKPLAKVRVIPIVPGLRSIIPQPDGSFSLQLPCGSARVLSVEAVQHEELMIPVLPARGEMLEFEARLRPLAWVQRFDSVRVVTEAGGYSPGGAVSMTRRRDGTYAATIPCASESLRYQLLGVAKDGLPTAGTHADTFFIRRGRGIASIRAGGQPVELTFDPRRLPRSRGEAVVRFADPHSLSASVFPLFIDDTREENRLGKALEAHAAAGGDPDSFRWDRSAYLQSLDRKLARERDPNRRQFLLLTYLRNGGGRMDSLRARQALDAIPPDSPLWGLSPGGPGSPLWTAWSVMKRPDLIRAYAEKGSETHPDRDTRAGFLSVAMSEAESAGDKDRLGRYVTRMTDEFQGTYHHEISLKRFSSNRKIRPGQPAPDVAFTALEDTSKVIRISDFRGQHLLLDFWAVWCGPCRAEMPQLHKAWDAFKDRGLALVSVSFDPLRADVAAYRQGKWAMPWTHAFADRGFGSEASAAYDVWGIPKAVLIGPDGTIVAEGDELRGGKLHGVLARVLGEPGAAATGKP